jgi:hypothetical protein
MMIFNFLMLIYLKKLSRNMKASIFDYLLNKLVVEIH